MFFLMPLEVKQKGDLRKSVPVANGLLIVANVLVYWLGWFMPIGPDTGVSTVLMYGFSHFSPWHLIGNMWVLLVFGNPVNRRLGNGYYLLTYFGTILALGLFGRLTMSGYAAGSSGAIFAVLMIATMLMPAAIIEIGYFALFPVTLLIGLLRKPAHWVFWFIRWDKFSMRVFWCMLLVPLIELWSLFWSGWHFTHMGHLFGMVCGVVAVLLLPKRITMKSRVALGT